MLVRSRLLPMLLLGLLPCAHAQNPQLYRIEVDLGVVLGLTEVYPEDARLVEVGLCAWRAVGHVEQLRGFLDSGDNAAAFARSIADSHEEIRAAAALLEDSGARVRTPLLRRVRSILTELELLEGQILPAEGKLKEPAGQPRPITQAEMDALCRAIGSADFDDAKLEILADWLQHGRCLYAAQLAGLLTLFDFDSSRVDAAVLATPRLHDRENLFQLAECFDFSSSFGELRAAVGD